MTVSELADAVIDGDRRALARAITLVESTRLDHRLQAEELLDRLLPHTGESIRLGVTGTPGVGKSTFINRFGSLLLDRDHTMAVLAVDPSSQSTGGSILGDKTRMAGLAGDKRVYIRPSPSGGVAGGIAVATRDAITVCEAAGFDIIVVETVGVGQSETAVANITDVFLLLVAPGGGDDLQGIKRGVMELADVVAINKSDGDLVDLARRTAADYRSALHLVRPKHPEATTPVVTCSSLTGNGLPELWSVVQDLHRRLATSGRLADLRSRQARAQLEAQISLLLVRWAADHPEFARAKAELVDDVTRHRLSVSSAARRLVATIVER